MTSPCCQRGRSNISSKKYLQEWSSVLLHVSLSKLLKRELGWRKLYSKVGEGLIWHWRTLTTITLLLLVLTSICSCLQWATRAVAQWLTTIGLLTNDNGIKIQFRFTLWWSKCAIYATIWSTLNWLKPAPSSTPPTSRSAICVSLLSFHSSQLITHQHIERGQRGQVDSVEQLNVRDKRAKAPGIVVVICTYHPCHAMDRLGPLLQYTVWFAIICLDFTLLPWSQLPVFFWSWS